MNKADAVKIIEDAIGVQLVSPDGIAELDAAEIAKEFENQERRLDKISELMTYIINDIDGLSNFIDN